VKNNQSHCGYLIGVIGAGPAGLYATKKFLDMGASVVLFNRDVKPGGLAEYGIFPTKYKMKEGLRKQFRNILAHERVDYYGHFSIGDKGDLTLEELSALGLNAIVVAAGAQGTKRLGIEGEDAIGVIHAKDLVYHYNHLPPFSQRSFPIGKRVAIIGMGNVMIDIAHFLLRLRQNVEEVVVVARRGPAERKYDIKEYRYVEPFVDQDALRQEIERLRPALEAVGQDADALIASMTTTTTLEQPVEGSGRMMFRFLASPSRVLADADGRVCALEVEENQLVLRHDRVSPVGTGQRVELPVDTVIFAIGDRVDETIGLPYSRDAFITNPEVDGTAPVAPYQVYDPEHQHVLAHTYVIGWSRKASDGLVGKAKQDAEIGSTAICQALAQEPAPAVDTLVDRRQAIRRLVEERSVHLVTKTEITLLEQAEKQIAAKQGWDDFKFDSNEVMFKAIERQKTASGCGVPSSE